MHRLVIFAALLGAVAVALPDVSEESDDVDTYFRTAGASLVKVDSEEDEGVKAFRYSYPLTYSVTNEEESSEDEGFIAPFAQTYSAAENEDSGEGSDESVAVPARLAYSAIPSIQPVGFKPLFTGYKHAQPNNVLVKSVDVVTPTKVVVDEDVSQESEDSVEQVSPQFLAYSALPSVQPVGFKQVFTGYKPAQFNSVVSPVKVAQPTAEVAVASVAPVAQEYSASTAKKVDTQVAIKPVSINVPTAFSPLVYTAPTVTHVRAVPSTGAVATFNNFYSTSNALTYPSNALTYSAPTFYAASKPFFYAQKINSDRYNYVVEKD